MLDSLFGCKGVHASLYGFDALNIKRPVNLKLLWVKPKSDTENCKEFAIVGERVNINGKVGT